MKNIIASNCIGGIYYQMLNIEYQNPFIWNTIKLTDFIKLITEWNNINFQNITTLFTSKECQKEYNNEKCSTIILDDKIKIYFIHHHYTPNIKSSPKPRPYDSRLYDVYGEDILEYIENKWLKRSERLNLTNPIFVYFDDNRSTNDNISKLYDLNLKYPLIIISQKQIQIPNKENLFFFKTNDADTRIIAKELNNFIKDKNL